MKKSVILLAGVVCSVTIGISCAMLLQPTEIPKTAPYVLRDENGKLALYKSGTDKPCIKYDIYTQLLPKGDVEALRYGVPVNTPEQLSRLLEDYGA